MHSDDLTAAIVGYGAYIPAYRLRMASVAKHWDYERAGRELPVMEKSVPGEDEDTVTMAIEAGSSALLHAGIAAEDVGGIWLGTESKPYAVKPAVTTIAAALGMNTYVAGADIEFACKAGTEALRIALGFVGSKMGRYALAIGMDTAQARPGDDLELTAAAGGGAIVVGPAEEGIAVVERMVSSLSDTPDFFRRAGQPYPEHGRRFTGQPSYFHHTIKAATRLLGELNAKPADYRYAVFHQPTPSFPKAVAQQLGFSFSQIEPGLIGEKIGNTYAGSSLLGLAATLDIAESGDRIFCVSYGSGAGSDAFSLRVRPAIQERRRWLVPVSRYLDRKVYIDDYATYLKTVHHLNREGPHA